MVVCAKRNKLLAACYASFGASDTTKVSWLVLVISAFRFRLGIATITPVTAVFTFFFLGAASTHITSVQFALLVISIIPWTHNIPLFL
jgi:hypothetical protein